MSRATKSGRRTFTMEFKQEAVALLLDGHSASSVSGGLVLPVLHRAIRERQVPPGLIHHTDRGGQYAGHRYRAILARAAFRQSMSRPDNCYDNAFMESCFGTLKTELEMTEYDHQQNARQTIGDYIAYYNLERKHSALGYLSPHQFETRLARLKLWEGVSVISASPQQTSCNRNSI